LYKTNILTKLKMSDRFNEQALSKPTIGGDSSNNKMSPVVHVSQARGAFFRNPGITKADVKNAQQNKLLGIISSQLSK
jgi:hypothetical protein